MLENESRKSSSEQSPPETDAFTSRSRFVVVLSRLEHLPAIMAITKLLHKPLDYWHEKEGNASPPAISIDALRLLELTDRTSAVQRAASLEETAAQDPLRNIYNTFASLNGFDVTPDMVVVPSTEYASTVVEFANIKHSDIIMLPWGSFDHHFSIETFSESEKENHSGPFDALFKPPPTPTSHGSPQHAAFIRHVFSEAFCDVGLFLDCSGFGSAPAVSGGHQHIFLPFFGGRDDRLALSLLVQLCHHPGVTASCVRFHYEAKSGTGTATSPVTPHTPASAPPAASSVSVVHSEDKSSSMADDLLWQRFFGPGHQPQPSTLQALSRIDRREMTTSTPLDTLQDELKQVSSQHSSQAMVLVGRHDDGHRSDLNTKLLKELSASEGPIMPYFKADGDVRRTVGSVAHAVLLSGLAGSMLVMQAARKQRGNRSRKSSLVV